VGRVRRRTADGTSQRASTLELFYDLVFVFAITQVSHLLLAHLAWSGVLHSLIALLAVYWSWNYTTWTTNELDTETVTVRLLLLTLMLVSLLMSVAIPQAFDAHALLFAGSYVAIQVGRHSFLTFAAADKGTVERERAGHILTWFVVVGVLWIAGALFDGPERVVLWLAALALDYCAPRVTYWVPGRPRLAPATWNVGTEHFAERFGLFIILALGESIVITGVTTSELELDVARITAFIMAFLASATIWWLYFSSVASLGEHYLEVSDSRTTVARDAYTYLHVVFVAGIILSAVGDELVIADPIKILPSYKVAAVAAGPAVYLLAHSLFRYRLTGSMGMTKPLGTLACVAVGFLGLYVPALVLAGLLIVVLVAVIGSSHLVAPEAYAESEGRPQDQPEVGTTASH
jgi:low temperature requirement protein LtrA